MRRFYPAFTCSLALENQVVSNGSSHTRDLRFWSLILRLCHLFILYFIHRGKNANRLKIRIPVLRVTLLKNIPENSSGMQLPRCFAGINENQVWLRFVYGTRSILFRAST